MSLHVSRPPLPILYIVLIASMLFWGGANVVGKHTIDNFPLFATLFLRFLIASIAILPVVWIDRHRFKITWRDVVILSLLGSLGTTLSVGLLFFGLTEASILDASIILALAPLLLAVTGWIWLNERYCPHTILGFILAVSGAIIALTLFRPMGQFSLFGDAIVLASVLSLVSYTIWSKEAIKRYSPTTIAAFSFFVAAISFAPLAYWEMITEPSAIVFDSGIIGGLLYMGIAASVVAYMLYEWSLAWIPATHVAALSYLQPLSSIWLGLIFLGESAYWSYAVGGVLVAIGVWFSLKKPHAAPIPPAKQVVHLRHLSRRN